MLNLKATKLYLMVVLYMTHTLLLFLTVMSLICKTILNILTERKTYRVLFCAIIQRNKGAVYLLESNMTLTGSLIFMANSLEWKRNINILPY